MITLAIFSLVLFIPFVTMPRDILRGVSPYSAVLKAILTSLASVLVVMAITSMTGHPLMDAYHDYIVEVTKAVLADDSLRNLVGMTDMTDSEAYTTLIAIYDGVFMVTPGIITMVSAVTAYFEYMILSRSFNKRHPEQKVELMPKFKEFTFPKNTVTAMVLMYFIAFFAYKGGMESGEIIFKNINYVFDLVFVIQGASVVFMYCDTRKWPKVIAILLVIILWSTYMLRQIVVILGMVDLIFNIKGFIIFKAQLRAQKKNGKDDIFKRK